MDHCFQICLQKGEILTCSKK